MSDRKTSIYIPPIISATRADTSGLINLKTLKKPFRGILSSSPQVKSPYFDKLWKEAHPDE